MIIVMTGWVPLVWGLGLNQEKWHSFIHLGKKRAFKQRVAFSVLIYGEWRKTSQEPRRWESKMGCWIALSQVKGEQKPPVLPVFGINEDTTHVNLYWVNSDPLDQLEKAGAWEALARGLQRAMVWILRLLGCECESKRSQTDWNLERSTGRTAVGLETYPGAKTRSSEWVRKDTDTTVQGVPGPVPGANVHQAAQTTPRQRVGPRPRAKLARSESKNLVTSQREWRE